MALNAIPVFPDVGSIIVVFSLIVPFWKPLSIIAFAILSLIEPKMFCFSIFANNLQFKFYFFSMLCSLINGVFPIKDKGVSCIFINIVYEF